ncbi:MAG: shikimate kinase [Planctomycetes bacterium]|nr:shikimate kinase [Planctomycetota bacterium]
MLALAGPRGAGKTTVGRLVAAALGRRFVDLDDEVERLAGASVREVFAREGEQAFRALEVRALSGALEATPEAVVALGGGTLTSPAARDLLRARARVVYLAAPAEVLAARVAADPRTADGRPPLRPGGPLEEARALLREREATDRAAADAVVDATRAPDDVAAAVVRVARGAPPRQGGAPRLP